MPATKATTARDDLAALIATLRARVLELTTASYPSREQVTDMRDRAGRLARRQRQTLLPGVTVTDDVLSQARTSLAEAETALLAATTATRNKEWARVADRYARALSVLEQVQRELPAAPTADEKRQTLRQRIERLLNIPKRQPAAPTNADTVTKREALLARAQAKFNDEVALYAKRYAADEIDIYQWKAFMKVAIRDLHFTAAAIGAGGIGALTKEAIAAMDARIREQANYLNNWAAQIERQRANGAPTSEAALANRARMYAGAAGTTASESEDVIAFAGFPKLPFYPCEKSACRNACACDWEWRDANEEAGNADVYWRLNAKRTVLGEHCPQCLARARAFAPLKIRGGVFVNMPSNMSPFLTSR